MSCNLHKDLDKINMKHSPITLKVQVIEIFHLHVFSKIEKFLKGLLLPLKQKLTFKTLMNEITLNIAIFSVDRILSTVGFTKIYLTIAA